MFSVGLLHITYLQVALYLTVRFSGEGRQTLAESARETPAGTARAEDPAACGASVAA
ncbi:MAG: hypothetical protein ABWY25_12645 [Paenisporosarcina sp.]